MRWWLNPLNLRAVARDARHVASSGGPVALRLRRIGHPEGWIFPASTVSLEIVGKDGAVTPLEPELPVPLPIAWSYRLARVLGVPVVASVKPEWFSAEIKLPRSGA